MSSCKDHYENTIEWYPINNKVNKFSWDLKYLKLAREVSTWSKDPSTQVGAVVVGEHGQILSQGYNGFPRGIEDTESRLNNREVKYSYVVHAEQNCIYNACLSGVSLAGGEMYIYGLPLCSECAKGVIQVGISRVVIFIDQEKKTERWMQSWEKSRDMLDEVDIKHLVMDFSSFTSDDL